MRVFPSSGSLAALVLVTSLAPSLEAQALIEAITPEAARVEVDLLGSLDAAEAQTGLILDVGDMITAREAGTQVTLSCPSGSTNLHLLTAPFRVMITEPVESECAIDLLMGQDDVLTEAPTEVNSGGIALENTGTQYRVEVRRGENGLQRSVAVFDGGVIIRAAQDTLGQVAAGSATTVAQASGATATVVLRAIRPREYETSAIAYARYDAEVGRMAGVDVSRGVTASLRGLHGRVLRAPKDTLARVELAKAQIGVKATNQALYNLRTVDVVEESKMQRYQIDAAVLNRGLSSTNQVFLESRIIGTVRPADRRPDLFIRMEGPRRVVAGSDVGDQLRVTVLNRGAGPAAGTDDAQRGGYMVDLVLSSDEEIPDRFAGFYPSFREDVLLRGGRLSNTPSVPAGDSVTLSVGSAIIPADTPAGRYCLGARVDPGNQVAEAAEGNNVACLTVEVIRRDRRRPVRDGTRGR